MADELKKVVPDFIADLRRTGEALEAKRRALPCANLDDARGAATCATTGTEPGCSFRRDQRVCPIERIERARLKAEADARAVRARREANAQCVPARERALILAGPLDLNPAMARVHRIVTDRAPVLSVLVGARGVGKTLAACWGIVELGGMYITAYQFVRPGLDVDAAKAVDGLLVIDQLGREHHGASPWGLSQLEEVIDTRYAELRLTLLVGNITRAELLKRYDKIIEDRLAGDDVFEIVEGKSRRGKAR